MEGDPRLFAALTSNVDPAGPVVYVLSPNPGDLGHTKPGKGSEQDHYPRPFVHADLEECVEVLV
jgi:hypothetical protein